MIYAPLVPPLQGAAGAQRGLGVAANLQLYRFSVKLLVGTSGLALSLCPALRLCKGKCLPNRCGRLTPPLAALPCGPPVSFADSPL